MSDERKNLENEDYLDNIDDNNEEIEDTINEEFYEEDIDYKNDYIEDFQKLEDFKYQKESIKLTKPEKEKKSKTPIIIITILSIIVILLLSFIAMIFVSLTTNSWYGDDFKEEIIQTTIEKESNNFDYENVDINTTLTFGESLTNNTTNVETIVENILPSMVIIEVYEEVTNEELVNVGAATGIIIGKNDEELLILTNEHVISGSDSTEIIFCNEEKYEANIKGFDVSSDIAIVSIPLSVIDENTFETIKIATMGDSNNLKLGEQVIVIGNSLGYGQSVTVGYISALNREITDTLGYTRTFIQSDAAINEGNSGGALINMNGEIVGITESKLVSVDTEGVGWSIPISEYKDVIEILMNQETKQKYDDETKGYLGVSCISVDTFTSEAYGIPLGVYVANVSEDGSANQAGILKGDVILMIDNHSVLTANELINLLDYYKSGEEANIVFARLIEGEYQEFKTTVRLKGKETIESLN